MSKLFDVAELRRAFESYCLERGISQEDFHEAMLAAGYIQPAAHTISEFCLIHRISEPLYYKIQRDGTGPREAIAGTRNIITAQAARDWRQQRELAAAERRQLRVAKQDEKPTA